MNLKLLIFVGILLFAAHFLAKLYIRLGLKGKCDKYWIYWGYVIYFTSTLCNIFYVWCGISLIVYLYNFICL
jgi:hypothetical protein